MAETPITAQQILVTGTTATFEAANVAGNSIDPALGNFLLWSAVALCGAVSIAAFVGMFWLTWPARR